MTSELMTPDPMTPDSELELTLELARASREPRAADLWRVLGAVRRRMQQGAGARAFLDGGAREGSGVHAISPWRRLRAGRSWLAPTCR